jgi:hypothetical protein
MSFFPQHTRLQTPKICSLQPKSFCFEIFNRGTLPFTFSIRQQDSYIVCTTDTGIVDIERCIEIGVDWAKVPAGTSSSRLWIDMQDQTVEITILLNPIDTMLLRSFKGFVASSGYVAMEAANYQQSYSTDKLQWKTIDNLGRTSSAVLVKPSVFIFDTITPMTPFLEYRFYSTDTDKVAVNVCLSPTLNFNENIGLRFVVSIDNELPRIINMNQNYTLKQWEKWVADNLLTVSTQHYIRQSGEHVLRFWPLDDGIVLQRIVIDRGGVRPSYLGPLKAI